MYQKLRAYLRTKFHKPMIPTIKVLNLDHQFISNGSLLLRATGRSFPPDKEKVGAKKMKLFVLDFEGDLWATKTKALGEEISAILIAADPKYDEVLIKINSGGGAAYAYGYASSQIERLKVAGIKVTVSVDKVAASGGYMMACVADKIIAAPFALIGSIGVASEVMNFHEALKTLGVDYKSYTAGEFKRTISKYGKIEEAGEKEHQSDIDDLHVQFKEHVSKYRTDLDIDAVANGKSWTGVKAMEIGLIDDVRTSDDYILANLYSRNIISVKYIGKRNVMDSFGKRFFSVLSEGLLSTFTFLTRGA